MVLPGRHAILAYFMALAPSIVIYSSITLPTPVHHDLFDLPIQSIPLHATDFVESSLERSEVSLSRSPKTFLANATEASTPFLNTKDTSWNTSSFGSEVGDSIAACLLVMDDNAILPEFLAYHYLRLPLRRLIVAMDPRSDTSPLKILDLYRSRKLMDISIWSDTDFVPENHKEIRERVDQGKRDRGSHVDDPLVSLHRDRQSYFISQCFNTLQKEGAKWVIHLDTDEYILPNYYALPQYKLDMSNTKDNGTSHPLTIYDMIQSAQHIDEHLASPCISLPRVRIGTRESPRNMVDAGLPRALNGIVNATNLQTFRWRWRNRFKTGLKSNGRAKAMVDVSRLSKRSLRRNVLEHNPHRPVEKECLVRNMYLDARNSTFLVHHYASTWEQWTARKQDARQTTDDNGRTREAWEKLRLLSVAQTDHIRPWLQDFVKVYGADLAKHLLKGVGELPANTSQALHWFQSISSD